MKNSLKLTFVLSLIFLFSLFSLVDKTYAFSIYGGKLEKGVGNWGNNTQYYWIDTSASYETALSNNAMYSWVYTSSILSTPISFTKTTNRPAAMIEIWKGSYFPSNQGIVGETLFYKSGVTVDPSTVATYTWCRIRLNDPNYSWLTSNEKQSTIAHEMGHAFGLAHNNIDPLDLMYWDFETNQRIKPAYDDLSGINYLY